MSDDDETPQAVEKPIFGMNGELLNREAFKPWSLSTAPISPRDTLRIAAPAYHRIWLAWLIAGLLNPTIFIWVVFFLIDGEFPPLAVFWCVSVPGSIAAGLGVAFARGRNVYSFRYLVLLSLKMWALVSGITIAIVSLMVLPAAPYVLYFGSIYAIVLGLPAALAGAIVARVIVFRRKQPAAPNAPLSTP
jgi:hypothetical protein